MNNYRSSNTRFIILTLNAFLILWSVLDIVLKSNLNQEDVVWLIVFSGLGFMTYLSFSDWLNQRSSNVDDSKL